MKKKAIILFVLLLSITLLLSACLPKSKNKTKITKQKTKESETDARTLRVAYMRAPTLNPLIDIAEQKGYFRQNGVKIRKIRAQGAIGLLTKRKADVALLSLVPALSAFLDNKDVRFIAAISNSSSMFLNTSRFPVSRFPKDKIAEVKKVGIAKLTKNERLIIQMLLNDMGLNVKLIKIEESLQESDRAKMLTEAKVDMVFIGSKKTRDALQSKGNYAVFDAKEMLKDYYMPSGIVSTKFALRKKPQAAKAFVKALYQAYKYINDNADELISILENKFHLSTPAANFMYKNLLEAGAGHDYVPNGNPAKLAASLASITRLENPQRDLSKFIIKKYAEEAVK